ncbi:uncharacterized protein LOC134263416 [Saccostrea cucullata]|uniref:uncharacterized protein LOC134263416 n=1 Tax=Saccostrea cuccullata TaxID=36930 RepID=UPI002ED6B5EC
MSLSKYRYTSTTETTNLARLARLILGPCTDALRDVLKKEISPGDLSKECKKWFDDPANHTARNRFNKQYMDLIFPLPAKQYGGNYSDFDISLLYQLLRNISKMPPHTKGWGKDPDPGDRSVSANIERVRVLRNKYYGHINEFSITDSEFRQEWRNIHDIVVELEMTFGTTTAYQDAVKEIKTCSMDPENETKYIQKLTVIDELFEKIESLTELHEKYYISKWKEEDKVFHEIHSFPSILEKVKNKPCVVFVGGPGSGKSAIAQHIALLLLKEGYEIVPIKDIDKIEEYCDLRNRQVFLLDDVVGVLGVQEAKINLLSDLESMILEPKVPDSKILMTCRETVFRKARQTIGFFSDESNIVLLHSVENELNQEDKICLMEAYRIDSKFLSTDDLDTASKMFPLLCKLFSTEKFESYGSSFFKCPIPCVLEEFDNMYKQNKIQYISLVLCMMNENKLSEEMLENAGLEPFTKNLVEIKENACKKLKISRKTDNFEFVDALCDMEGTFTKLNDGEYIFIHDAMLEILAYHLGLRFPELIINYMKSSYISNYVKPQKCKIKPNDRERNENEIKDMRESQFCADESDNSRKPVDLCVYLDEENYPLLAERLYRDIEDMHLYDDTPLTAACQEGHEKIVRELIKNESDVNLMRDSYHLFPKPSQLNVDRLDLVNQHLNMARIDVNTVLTPLVVACRVGHIDVVKELLQAGADINAYSVGESPLIAACKCGYVSIVHHLLESGAEVNPKHEGYIPFHTPLTAACYHGHMNVVKKLLEAGADVNLHGINYSSLSAACDNGHLDVVKELCKHGADINLQSKFYLHMTFSMKCRRNVRFNRIWRSRSRCRCYKCYIQKHHQIRRDSLLAVTNLMKSKDEKNLHFYCIPLIIASGELQKLYTIVNPDTILTPLTTACRGGHIDLVKYLLKNGVDANSQDQNGTPLIVACREGHMNVVMELIEHGANINLYVNNETPLIAAVKGNHSCIIKELLKAGALS